ncbi:hypothetical protein [Streptomyces sp. NRRL B-3229]|uniref:hypothetical protein n=1 Tax=Streptomyces sp. NRRL B-3229 TaxID=1463836 RepID=UPI00099DE746|nr:hypothetical protein [Streptomyces sp. NRRL B-3229]
MDAEAYGGKNDRRQSETQHDLPRLLDRAARNAGMDRAQWQIQRKGDEQLAVRRLDGTEPRLVDDYIRHLVAELREYNAQRVSAARMRLRAVIHQGPVELADNGFAGAAVVATARLLNASPLYDALATHPGADLALLLSDDVFRSTVLGGHTTLTPADFTPVSVRVKEYEARAWLWVPADGRPTVAPPRSGLVEAEEPTASAGAGTSTDRYAQAISGTAGGPVIDNEYRADRINVTNVAGPVDARGAVFGFGSAGD